ncbi:MAG: hypothetical protein CR217_14885 [Beijerinckiaceae bacterium]|nr:MAG: hypothetical protein CR217_14885 [Beijerinckiaceae bacterium]
MTIHAKAPPPGGEGGALELSFPGGNDFQTNSPKQVLSQEDNRASEITCASMRADELRGCLIREISRAMAIGLQAQAALLDGDDDAALANLRRHWRATRADIGSLAGELGALRRARAVP